MELFSGTQSISREFRARGHETFTVDYDEVFKEPDYFNTDLHIDVNELTVEMVLEKFGQPDIIWASCDCFVKGTLVWTDSGFKPIEEIKVGEKVLTHKNRYKQVYATMKGKTDVLCDVKLAGSEVIQTTSNHPFYVREKSLVWNNETRSCWVELGDTQWLEAEKLTKDYRVGIPINTIEKLPEWNGVPMYSKNQFGIELSVLENKIKPLLNNEDFWWLIGRYMGDGYYLDNGSRHNVEICCNKTNGECEDIRVVLDRLPEFNYNFSEKTTTNVFSIHRKELVEFVKQFGKGSGGKRITDDILSLPRELLRSFLDGYLSADGHYEEDRSCYKFTTVSEQLAYGLQKCILKVYGKYCSISTKDACTSVIDGRTVNCKKQYILSFYSSSERMNYLVEDGFAWVNVSKVKVYEEKSSVYNISVEDDESYTVNNFIVHNCTTYSIAGIYHHRRKDESGNLNPISEKAKFADKTNKHVMELIKALNPKYYFIENPRAGMRKMDFIQDFPRHTVTYCQYTTDLPLEQRRMKPTDLWTNHPDPKFKPICKNGAPCHVAAPRGSQTGTQGMKNAIERSRIPEELCKHIVRISEE